MQYQQKLTSFDIAVVVIVTPACNWICSGVR
jgi:hypothetical protein